MYIGWFLLGFVYLAVLFYVAKWGDTPSNNARRVTSHPLVYSLALGIYCTAWTFFGAVGQSTQLPWMYLTIIIGPVIVYTVFYRFIYKLTFVGKKQHINSIADFISSRYGKRQAVALLVTSIAFLAIIPYVALQLKAIGSVFQLITNQPNSALLVLMASIFIALFSMYFGTRNTDVTQYRRGLILAISFESIVKLLALILVAIVGYFYWSKLKTGPLLSEYTTAESFSVFMSLEFWVQTLMAGTAAICLPRQFHVAVVDNLKLAHLKTARWFFPLYLCLIAITIPIIASVGKVIFANQGMDPDNYVMGIAILSDSLLLQTVVFLGGTSAATAMIIISTLTLSTMVTNDVILPKLMEKDQGLGENRVKRIKHIRRIVIFAILLLAFIYQQQIASKVPLASIGLLAFSLVIQLLPSIVGGLYWKKGHAHGVYAGLIAGFLVWVMFLILPALDGSPGLNVDTQQNTMLTKMTLYSFVTNIIFYIGFSLLAKPKLIDQIQANLFVEPSSSDDQYSERNVFEVSIEDLKTLIARFTGEKRCEQLFDLHQQEQNTRLNPNDKADETLLAFCERALGGVVGSSSAKALIDSVVRGKKLGIAELVNFFDDTTQAMQFNMTAFMTALENIDQGISVIDKDLKLLAWNKSYTDLFNFPKELMTIGTDVEELIRHNVLRGNCTPGEVNIQVEKRMSLLRNGTSHKIERQRDDGHVVEIVGNPLPGGGFVSSFHDVTGYVEIQKALRESNIDLAARVEKRTEEVHSINAELRLEIERRNELEKSLIRARKEAETANESKTRFLALASHDVLQPLNAAKLYLTALQENQFDPQTKSILSKLNDSVVSSESLISTILDISRLDQGELKPFIEPINISETVTPIINEMGMKAKEKGLIFKYRVVDCWISGDKTYLYRIIQNLVSNAIKYTQQGKVLLIVRKQKGKVLIKVYDTGIGISKLEQAAIFSDFFRVANTEEQGIGLGLGVVKRLTQQLNCNVRVDSTENKGSCFSVEFTESGPPETPKVIKKPAQSIFNKLKILCIDDQRENLDAMETLLLKWGIEIELAQNYQQALEIAKQFSPHILLVDYQLGRGPDGIELIEMIRQQSETILPACLITAQRGDELLQLCSEQGVNYLSKPIKPAKLRTLIQSMAKYIRNVDIEENKRPND